MVDNSLDQCWGNCKLYNWHNVGFFDEDYGSSFFYNLILIFET